MNNRSNHNGRNSCKDSDSYLHNYKDRSTDGYTDTYTHTYTYTLGEVAGNGAEVACSINQMELRGKGQ